MPYEGSKGKQCVVFGCSNTQKVVYAWKNSVCVIHHEKNSECPCLQPFRIHCLPKDETKKKAWLKAINRKEFNPTAQSLVCSQHFVDGRPTSANPVPTVNMGYDITDSATPRPRRKLVRRPLITPDKENVKLKEEVIDNSDDIFIAAPMFVGETCNETPNDLVIPEPCDSVCSWKYPGLCKNKPLKVDVSCQTEDLIKHDHPYAYEKSTRNMGTQHTTAAFGIQDISSDSDARFYTGLNLAILTSLITMLSSFGKHLPYKLPIGDQILSVLMRLRLGLKFHDIGRRFNVSRTLASAIYSSWINIVAVKLSDCVVWLPRETIRRTMPSSFRELYPNTTCIIDCFEVFIQRPFSLKARNQTYSTYKSHNTAKVLVAIAPNGFIMFTSKSFGGRASDNFITKSSGVLDYLLPGDEVMADRGFTIAEALCSRRVKLNIPFF